MKRIYIIESFRGAKVCCPPNAYMEKVVLGRCVVKAMLFPGGGFSFYLFKDNKLKAVVSDNNWYISRMDGECQNLLNRLLSIYG